MKIFFYKSILVFILFILAIHLSFGLIKKQVKREYTNLISKEGVEHFKNKIREELNNATKKKILINSEDTELLNNFLIKLKSELKKTNNK
jgi:regulatory protein YycI of two-component signal transduction system YycFG